MFTLLLRNTRNPRKINSTHRASPSFVETRLWGAFLLLYLLFFCPPRPPCARPAQSVRRLRVRLARARASARRVRRTARRRRSGQKKRGLCDGGAWTQKKWEALASHFQIVTHSALLGSQVQSHFSLCSRERKLARWLHLYHLSAALSYSTQAQKPDSGRSTGKK